MKWQGGNKNIGKAILCTHNCKRIKADGLAFSYGGVDRWTVCFIGIRINVVLLETVIVYVIKIYIYLNDDVV